MMELAFMIICIIGLVIAIVLPWVVINDLEGDESDAWYDRSLERIDSHSSEDMPEELWGGDIQDYYSWGFAFLGLLMGIIISAVMFGLHFVVGIPRLFAVSTKLLMGLSLFVYAALVLIVSMRAIGGFMISLNSDATEVNLFTPAPLALAIIGMIMLGLSVLIVGKYMRELRMGRFDRATVAPPYLYPGGGY